MWPVRCLLKGFMKTFSGSPISTDDLEVCISKFHVELPVEKELLLYWMYFERIFPP